MINIIYALSTIVIICAILLILAFGVRILSSLYKESRFVNNSEKANEIINQLDETIRLSVMITNKSFVDKLKQSNSFLQQDKEEAFYEAKNRTLNLIDEEDLTLIQAYINDSDEWINSRIEYYVRLLKKN